MPIFIRHWGYWTNDPEALPPAPPAYNERTIRRRRYVGSLGFLLFLLLVT